MSKYRTFETVKKIFYSWPLPYGLAPSVMDMLRELLDAGFDMGASDDFIELARMRQKSFELQQGMPVKSVTRYLKKVFGADNAN